MFTLTLAKLDMIGARLGSNGLIASGDYPVYIQLVIFCYYPLLVN